MDCLSCGAGMAYIFVLDSSFPSAPWARKPQTGKWMDYNSLSLLRLRYSLRICGILVSWLHLDKPQHVCVHDMDFPRKPKGQHDFRSKWLSKKRYEWTRTSNTDDWFHRWIPAWVCFQSVSIGRRSTTQGSRSRLHFTLPAMLLPLSCCSISFYRPLCIIQMCGTVHSKLEICELIQ